MNKMSQTVKSTQRVNCIASLQQNPRFTGPLRRKGKGMVDQAAVNRELSKFIKNQALQNSQNVKRKNSSAMICNSVIKSIVR